MARPRPAPCSGFALIAAISVLALVFVLGYAYSVRTSGSLYTTSNMVASLRATYLAEGALVYGLSHRGDRSPPYHDKLTMTTGTATIDVSMQSGVMWLVGQSQVGSVTRTITATVDSEGTILKWRESTR